MKNLIDEIWNDIEKSGWELISSKKDYYKKKTTSFSIKTQNDRFKKELMNILIDAIIKDLTIHEAVVLINNFENE